jgi:hypothetical protein
MNSNGENLRENSPIITISCQIDQASGARPHNLKKPQINQPQQLKPRPSATFPSRASKMHDTISLHLAFGAIAELQRSFKPILSNNELN